MSPLPVPLTLLVLMVTLPPCRAVRSVAVVISETGIAALSRNVPAPKGVSGVAVPTATILMSVGSSNSKPARPRAAEVSTRPLKISAPLPDTSTNPPFPPSLPPRANMPARKLVASSAHTTTFPPLPFNSASALMTTWSPT